MKSVEEMAAQQADRAAAAIGCTYADVIAVQNANGSTDPGLPEHVRALAAQMRVTSGAVAEALRRVRLTDEDQRRASWSGKTPDERLVEKACMLASAAQRIVTQVGTPAPAVRPPSLPPVRYDMYRTPATPFPGGK